MGLGSGFSYCFVIELGVSPHLLCTLLSLTSILNFSYYAKLRTIFFHCTIPFLFVVGSPKSGINAVFTRDLSMDFTNLYKRVDELEESNVSFLAHICTIPALGPDNQGSGEMEKYLAVKEEILKLNPDRVEEVHAPDDRVPDGVRPNLLAIFNGKDTSRTLWILTHVDIVPPGERRLWKQDPYKPYIEDGLLYGRGVEDNGQALAASIFAVKAAKETVGLSINVGLAIVSDEETGSGKGLDYVLETRPDLFGSDDLIVVPDAGNRDGDAVEIAEKHLFQVKFTVKGLQGHASVPQDCRNTMRTAAHMIVAVDDALHAKFSNQNEFFNPPVSTFEPTRKDSNVPNVNTIPGEDVFYFDCRILPGTDPGDVLKEMREVAAPVAERFGCTVEVEKYLLSESPHMTPTDAPVVIELAQALQEVLGVQAKPHGIGGQTVATFFRRKKLNAVVWGKILHLAHAPNEHIKIANLTATTKVFARMMA